MGQPMNPMELLYFDDNGRLNIDHECEMCEKFPLEDLNAPCLGCGYSQTEMMGLNNHVANTNRAIDFYNVNHPDESEAVVYGELTLSHVSIGGNDCNKIVLCDYSDSPHLVPLFAPFVHQVCDVVIYPKQYDGNEDITGWVIFGENDDE